MEKFHFIELEGSFCIQKSLPLVPLLRQMYPVHTFPPYFSKIHSKIVLPSMTRSSKRPHPIMFCNQNFVCISPTISSSRYGHNDNDDDDDDDDDNW
jgi:hypothetical protein